MSSSDSETLSPANLADSREGRLVDQLRKKRRSEQRPPSLSTSDASDSDRERGRRVSRKSQRRSHAARDLVDSDDTSDSDYMPELDRRQEVRAPSRSKSKRNYVNIDDSARIRELQEELDRRELEIRRRESIIRREQGGGGGGGERERERGEGKTREKKSVRKEKRREEKRSKKDKQRKRDSDSDHEYQYDLFKPESEDEKADIKGVFDDLSDEERARRDKKKDKARRDKESRKREALEYRESRRADKSTKAAQDAAAGGQRTERDETKSVMRFVQLEALVPTRPEVATAGLNTLFGVGEFVKALEDRLGVLSGKVSEADVPPPPRSYAAVFAKLLVAADAAFDALHLPRPVNRTAWDLVSAAEDDGPREVPPGFPTYIRGDAHQLGWGGDWWGAAAWREIEKQNILGVLVDSRLGEEKKLWLCDLCGAVTPSMEAHYGDSHSTHPNNNTRYFQMHTFEHPTMKHLLESARLWYNRHTDNLIPQSSGANKGGRKTKKEEEEEQAIAELAKRAAEADTCGEDRRAVMEGHRKNLKMSVDYQVAIHIWTYDVPLATRVNFTLNTRARISNTGADKRPAPPAAGSALSNLDCCWDYYVDVLLEALRLLPVVEPPVGEQYTTCYRCCPTDQLPADWKKSYFEGRVVSYAAITTAVRHSRLANHFLGWGGGGLLLVIKVITARSLNGYSDVYVGGEYVLLPDTWYRVHVMGDSEKFALGASIGRDLNKVKVLELTEVDSSNGRGVLNAMKADEVYRNSECIPLLNTRSPPVGVDASGNTALHLAAKINGNAEIVRLITKCRVNINAQNKSGFTPLHLAIVDHGEKETAKALLIAGAKAHIKNSAGYTALHYAAQNAALLADLFDQLVDAGGLPKLSADPKSFPDYITDDQHRTSLLHLVCASPSVTDAIVERVVKTSSSKLKKHIDQFNSTALHNICANPQLTMTMLRTVLDFYVAPNAGAEERQLLNDKDGYGLTPLLHLSSNAAASFMLCELLVERGSDVKVTDGSLRTVLHRLATWTGKKPDWDVVKLFVDKGISVNARDSAGATMMHIFLGRDDVADQDVDKLREFGCDATILGANDNNILHTYLKNLSLKEEVLRSVMSLAKGSSSPMTQQDGDGYSPLHHAVSNPSVTADILKYLFDNGAELADAGDGSTLLQLCIQASGMSGEVVTFLLEKGAKLVTDEGEVDAHPLFTYVGGGQVSGQRELRKDVLQILLKKSGEVSAMLDSSGMSVLHHSCRSPSINPDILSIILKDTWGIINTVDRNGRTAMHYLAENESVTPELIDIMLEKKADLAPEDHASMTPLHLICANRSLTEALLKALIKGNPPVNAIDGMDRTGAHYLAVNPTCLSADTVKILAGAGAKFDLADSDGNSPIHLACENTSVTPAIIAAMMHQGYAAANMKNRKKQTPSQIAADMERNDIRKELKKHSVGGPGNAKENDDGGDDNAEPAEELSDEVDVKLVSYPDGSRIAVIKALMACKPSLVIKQASKLVDAPPVVIGREKKVRAVLCSFSCHREPHIVCFLDPRFIHREPHIPRLFPRFIFTLQATALEYKEKLEAAGASVLLI